MFSLVSLILIVSLSMLITKIAAIMLVHTGLSHQVAQFQARSAFTGVGFTTSESETIINHPVRRRIVMSLMLIGNAGIITAMASLMLTFIGQGESTMDWPIKLGILSGGLFLLWLISSSKYMNRLLSRIITRALKKYTKLNIKDYTTLLHISGGFSITELLIEEGDWLANKKLRDASLRDEGLNVLGIQNSDGSFVGVLTGDTVIEKDDKLLLYGREEVVKKLDHRKNDFFGDLEHQAEAREHQQMSDMEKKQKADS